MREIAERAGIAHMCEGIERTYDDRVEEWKVTYDESYRPYEKVDHWIDELYTSDLA
jgi:L-amino acid N-acyltransferase YncA